jgi:hypothetical protein
MLVPIKVKSLKPDRSKYKAYDILFEPENLEVQLEISDKEVEFDDNVYYVTKAGLKQIIAELADLVDEVDLDHLHSLNK